MQKFEVPEKDLDDKMKVVELELQSFLKTDSFNAVAETIVENTLVASAQIVEVSLKKHLAAPMERLDNVRKKHGRLRNALLEDGILDLISLNDD